MRNTIKTASILLGICVLILGCNYALVDRGLSKAVAGDPRNEGIHVFAHYKYFLIPNSLVFDLRSIDGQKSMLDVTRVLLLFAQDQRAHHFSQVTLAYQGTPKFRFDGEYFNILGKEFREQNPVYTIRTIPEHLYRLDGQAAFPTWSGGLLGVLGKQMDDVTSFHRQWYLDEISGAVAGAS